MGKRIAPKQVTTEQIQAEIDADFLRWKDIYRNGCNDPCWEDGMNLNLVRNHIIYRYRLLDEISDAPVQLSLFGGTVSLEKRKPIPPAVSMKYMARPGNLKRGAERTLTVILQDPNYRYIVALGKTLSETIKKRCSYENVIRYPESIAWALEHEAYPRMRSYQDVAYWSKTYAEFRGKIEGELEKEKNGQISTLPLEDDSKEYDED